MNQNETRDGVLAIPCQCKQRKVYMIIYNSESGNLLIARRYVESGLNIIPIKADGSKAAAIRFSTYTRERLPWYLAQKWFSSRGRPHAIGVLCGSTSGGLEVMDFDLECGTIFPSWSQLVGSEMLSRLPTVQTPKGGRHVYYRCQTVQGGQKLAENEQGLTLIETRGQGNYVLAPGSPPQSHSTGNPYLDLSGDLLRIPTITMSERQALLAAARSFNRYVRPSPAQMIFDTEYDAVQMGNRPGDEFNRAASWPDVLAPHGWEHSHYAGTTEYWTRPGKVNGCSASTNHEDTDVFYVFSSNAQPFEAGRGYTKFSAYALLNHHGDFRAAAAALAAEGYGKLEWYDVNDFVFGGGDE